MTEADPAFDTVHPSGHILVRSCRGGYMHSVTLSEAAMHTDAESLTQGILLTADVSYLKAVMEVRGEIVAAGYATSREAPTVNGRELASGKLVCGKKPHESTLRNGRRASCPGWTASRSGAISVGGSTGLAPNNSRARPSSARTAFSCCCSPESATRSRYPDDVIRTIHRNLRRLGPRLWPVSQRSCGTAVDGTLGRWRSSVGIRRGSASGELPKNR